MSNLKPGDRALVVGALFVEPRYRERNNQTCVVKEGPTREKGWPSSWVDMYLVRFDDGLSCWVMPSKLIRLPPDSEAKRLFRETEKPVEA